MPRKPDWLDFAHSLHKEAVSLRATLPPGVECELSLSDYGWGHADFSVSLHHRETDLRGFGIGPTPAAALEKATAALKKAHAEQQKRPQLVTGAKTLPAKGGE